MAAPAPGTAAAPRGNLLTNKLGPLPTWVWLGVATLLIVGVALFMRRKSSSSTGQAAPGQTAGVQQVPDIIIQNGRGPGQQPPAGSVPPSQPAPTGAGSGPPTSTAPAGSNPPPWWSQPPVGPFPGTSLGDQLGQAIAADPNYPHYVPPPAAKPKPAASTPPKPKAVQYITVTVAKWTSKHPPWNSTLSGIASHYNVAGGAAALAKLNGIKNENLIYPGQKIRVPTTS